MAVFGVAGDNSNDEIAQYQIGRYISTNEALWKIYSFPINERYPAVVPLAVHLENGQRVYFTDANVQQRAEQPPATTLTAFFQLCESDEFARTLLYSDVTHYFTWTAKKWQRRKQGTPVDGHPGVFFADTMGRLYTVHPNNTECYYLRVLLVNVVGLRSFQHLRIVNGHLCVTYRKACEQLGLLENDAHWDLTLHDASIASSPHQILNAVIEKTYKAQEPLELNLIKGEIITNVIETDNDGWFEGKLNGKAGLFHSSYARILNNNDESNTVVVFRDKTATINRLCKAVYSYTQNNDDELSLAVGDVIDFIEEVEEGWWRGRLKNKIGVFPSNFVEVMEPSPVLAIKRGQNTPAQTKKNLSNSKENLVSAGITSDKDAPVLPPKPVRELCRVSYGYDPANEDELELVVGDVITILSKDLPDKGWWKGEFKGKIGVFPDNFVTIITEAPPIRDSHNQKPDRPPLSTKVSIINKSPSGTSASNSSVRKDSFGSKDSLNETGIVVGNVAAHRLSLETRSVTYDGLVTEKTNRKSIETKAGSDIRKSLENLDDKKSTPPPVLSKKPVVPIKKSPTISSVTGNLFSGFKQKVKGESKLTVTQDNLDGGGHSKPTSFIADINEIGVIGDKIKRDDLDFDHVERGSVLQDMRAGRAKAPKRRPPSAALNVISDRSSYMLNGNDESLTDIPSHVDEDASKPKSREWEKHKAPWMEELKASQMKKTSPNTVEAKSPENNKQETSSGDHESFKGSELSKSFTSSYIPSKYTKSTTSESSNYEMRTSSVEVVKSSITESNTRNDAENTMVKSMSAISNGVSFAFTEEPKLSNIRPISTLLDESKSSNIRPISMNLRNRSISPAGRNSLTKSLTVTPPEITKITNIVTSSVATTNTATTATTSTDVQSLPVTNDNICNRVAELELRLGTLEHLVQLQKTAIEELVETLRDEKDKVKFLKTELDKYAQCVTQV